MRSDLLKAPPDGLQVTPGTRGQRGLSGKAPPPATGLEERTSGSRYLPAGPTFERGGVHVECPHLERGPGKAQRHLAEYDRQLALWIKLGRAIPQHKYA